MTESDSQAKLIQFAPQGTCCGMMYVAVKDDIIQDAQFMGGCPGNLQAVRQLIKGLKIDEVVAKLKGIDCGGKGTSCPDQLALGLIAYKNGQLAAQNIS